MLIRIVIVVIIMITLIGTGLLAGKKFKNGVIEMKEIIVASILGLSMAVGAYVLGIIRGGFEIAAIVGISMFSIVFIGSVIGLCLPFILTKLKLILP